MHELSFIDKVDLLLRKSGKPKLWLAKTTGVQSSTVARWFKNENSTAPHTLTRQKVSEAFGIPFSEFERLTQEKIEHMQFNDKGISAITTPTQKNDLLKLMAEFKAMMDDPTVYSSKLKEPDLSRHFKHVHNRNAPPSKNPPPCSSPETVLEDLCAEWRKTDLDEVRKALKEINQAKLLGLILDAIPAFASELKATHGDDAKMDSVGPLKLSAKTSK